MPGALESNLRRLANDLTDGIAVCQQGRIVWANRSLGEMTGRPAETLIGLEPTSLLEAGAGETQGTSTEQTFEGRLIQTGGRSCSVRIQSGCMGAGTDSSFWVFHDQGRIRELETEVMHIGRQLRQANLEVEQLRERVRRESAELDEVLTVVSHELRTPVTVVTGYSRLLLSERVGTLNDEQQKFLKECVKSCKRINTFIANLLENSRGATNDAPLQVHEASLAPDIEGVVSAFKPLLDEHGLALTLRLDPSGSTARFDPIRIEQVLSNLVENAIKYTPRGGTIEIATKRLKQDGRDTVEVSVSDDGPGVAEADRERIFEPYVRAGEARNAGSLGLGLAICKRAILAHGGVMGVTDSAAGGARFWFTLPASCDRAEEGD